MQLRIRVRTNARKFAITYKNGIVIHATEKPQRDRVNIEITQELSRIFNRRVWIKAGMHGRDKIIEVEGSEDEILEKLQRFC